MRPSNGPRTAQGGCDMVKQIKRELEQHVGAVSVEVRGYTAYFYSEEDGRLVCTYNMRTGKVSHR